MDKTWSRDYDPYLICHTCHAHYPAFWHKTGKAVFYLGHNYCSEGCKPSMTQSKHGDGAHI